MVFLVAATSAAFVVTERLKLERAPITAPRFTREFSPVCDCETDVARLQLRFRRPEVVTAVVVDRRGNPVRTLAESVELPAGRHVFRWDGRDADGAVVDDGRYRLRVRFERERRTILVPTVFRVDTRPPRLLRAEAAPEAISPDGDRRGDRLTVSFRAAERAVAELRLGDDVVARTPFRAKREPHSIRWRGVVRDPDTGEKVPLRKGVYDVDLVLRDAAGNETVETFPVRVRYIELDESVYDVAPGGVLRFAVDTDVETYRWSLFRPRAGRLGRPVLFDEAETEREVSVRLPADARPGTYLLRASEAGKRARAVVTVREPSR